MATKKATESGVYRVTEIIGTSPTSWEDAARTAVETAATSLRDLRVAEVNKLDLKIEGGKVVETPEPKIAPVIDIMEALKRSLAEKKKPARAATAMAAATEAQAEEEAPAEPAARKRTRRSRAV